eukprot:TRINITY_DN68421_c0_g1_i1.p2 TRINITY_DN68421_c0_g1~~TRINITY_DN68421_c0_g1_i1.p2  ORF type:complete len:123 (+),score=38.84 TRINITY_DN68421_c0_g1_i1:71-439(+)
MFTSRPLLLICAVYFAAVATGMQVQSREQERRRQKDLANVGTDPKQAVADLRAYLQEKNVTLEIILQQFDADGNGEISMQEFADGLLSFDEKVQKDSQGVFLYLDANSDEKLSQDEISKLFN